MELLGTGSGLAGLVRDEWRDEPFTLVDVGCSGGIDAAWRGFEPHLRAVGIDPNVEECARLAATETNANVRYVDGFAAWDHSTEFAKSVEKRGFVGNNPWNRLAVAATTEIRNAKVRSNQQLTSENQWQRVELSSRQIRLTTRRPSQTHSGLPAGPLTARWMTEYSSAGGAAGAPGAGFLSTAWPSTLCACTAAPDVVRAARIAITAQSRRAIEGARPSIIQLGLQ